MCDFKPGDEVVCVKGAAGTFPNIGYVEIVEGQTYTIDAVWQSGERGETGRLVVNATVQLVELGRLVEGDTAGFDARRFRKVQRRDLSAWLATTNTIEEPKRTLTKAPA